MKRPWAVLLTAATLVSCRSSQPTTNPFMRTTVAPPATTPGVIVTPGQPYAQGISPPLVTSPAPPPVTIAPIAPQQVAPIMPAPIAAPMVAPPPVVPNGARFHPPGGDYMFHQSSHESPPAKAHQNGVQLASASEHQPTVGKATQQRTVVTACSAPPSDEPLAAPGQVGDIITNPYVKSKTNLPTVPIVMRPDGTVLNPYVKANPAAPKTLPLAVPNRLPATTSSALAPVTRKAPASAVRQAPTSAARQARPPATMPGPRLTFATPSDQTAPNLSPIRAGNSPQSSTLRIIGESSGGPAVARVKSPAPGEPAVLRITANESAPSLRATMPSKTAPAGGNLTISASPASQNSANLVAPEAAPAVVRASFQPAAGSAATGGEYSHTSDYQSLRGKLEYSSSLRQWKLRYIPIDGRTDAYGGSVILPDSPALAGFKAGDVVEIHGALPTARISSGGFAPQYTPTSIKRLSR